MSNETLSCGELLKRINDIFEKKANNELSENGITFSQLKILAKLSCSPDGSFTLKELERIFGVTQATIAGIAVRLEKKHLVKGYIDSDDRRIKHISILPEGRKVCDDAKESMKKCEQWLLDSLDENEQNELRYLFQKIYDNIR